jgi:hypothetical protein
LQAAPNHQVHCASLLSTVKQASLGLPALDHNLLLKNNTEDSEEYPTAYLSSMSVTLPPSLPCALPMPQASTIKLSTPGGCLAMAHAARRQHMLDLCCPPHPAARRWLHASYKPRRKACRCPQQQHRHQIVSTPKQCSHNARHTATHQPAARTCWRGATFCSGETVAQ